ncbi:VWA domain-containing protein [Cryobacterium sp. BB736]|uniref:vWA domain-containing protein n=1 Tax=Cryobacterium sp. BB736 TaxID=2746963 RepID=UPI001874CB12
MSASRQSNWTRVLRVATVIGLGATISIGSAVPATGAELSETGSEAFADIASCAATGDRLLAAIVVDTSGSLRQTDPQDSRVGAILQALESLAQLNSSSSSALDVEASLATFSDVYRTHVDWGSVADAHLASLRDFANGPLRGMDNDDFTDYRAALRGAQQSLNDRAAALDGTSCKVLLWFTDGKLDVGAATETARSELCTPQGIVDGVRGDKISVVALTLFTAAGKGSVEEVDRDRLRAIAEGESGAERCGTLPVPPSSARGANLNADDATGMRRLFAQATAMIEGATPGLSALCPQECPDGELPIPVDPGIGGFRLILERSPSAAAPKLHAADGSSATLTPDTKSLGGADVVVSDLDGLLTADVTFADPDIESVEWRLAADPAGTTVVDLYYFWGASLLIEPPSHLFVGETSTVSFRLIHSDGSVLDPAIYDSFDLLLSLDGVQRTARPSSGGSWSLDIDLPTTEATPTVQIEATARAYTSPNRLSLGPLTASMELATSLPPSFPTVSPSRLTLPTIVGEDAVVGTLTIAGSERGATRACFNESAINSPESAGTATFTSALDCIDVPQGETVMVEFNLSTERPADGRIDGVLPITLEAVDASDTVTLNVPFSTTMVRPVNEPLRLLFTALFVVLALAVVWLTAEAARRMSDKFILGLDARVASIEAVATPAGLRRSDGRGGSLLDAAFDFQPVGMDKRRRLSSFSAGGLDFRRSFPLNPLQPGKGWVKDPGGKIVVSPGARDMVLNPDGTRAPVEFPGTLGALFIADPRSGDANDATEARGRLVMVIDSPDGVASVLEERIDEIQRVNWEDVIEKLRVIRSVRADQAAKAVSSPKASRKPSPKGTRSVHVESSESMVSGPPPTAWDDSATAPTSFAGSQSHSPTREKSGADKPPLATRTEPSTNQGTDAPPPSPTKFWDD